MDVKRIKYSPSTFAQMEEQYYAAVTTGNMSSVLPTLTKGKHPPCRMSFITNTRLQHPSRRLWTTPNLYATGQAVACIRDLCAPVMPAYNYWMKKLRIFMGL